MEDAIGTIAGGILHDHRLHILSNGDSEYIYYYAVPSKWVTHDEQFMTPLAMALPGHPGHRGNGIYVLNTSHARVAVVKRSGEFFLLSEESSATSAIEKVAHDYGLPIHTIEETVKPWPLESVYSRQRNLIGQVVGKVAKAVGYILGACVALYALFAVTEVYLERVAKDKAVTGSAGEVVKQFQYASPLSEQLAHFQQISAAVVRAGGWIEGYIWRPGKGEAFEITLPGWVSRDYIEALGTGTVVDYSIPENLVFARKGDLEKMSKP